MLMQWNASFHVVKLTIVEHKGIDTLGVFVRELSHHHLVSFRKNMLEQRLRCQSLGQLEQFLVKVKRLNPMADQIKYIEYELDSRSYPTSNSMIR